MVVAGYYCSEKAIICPNANDRGYCNLTGCCFHTSTATTSTGQTITLNPVGSNIGKVCEICGNGFEIYSLSDTRHICPECIKRLKELLYAET